MTRLVGDRADARSSTVVAPATSQRTVVPTASGRTHTAGPAHREVGAWVFRKDVEGLRAIAIILVVLFHSGLTAFRGGFFGVDVFFVLSGFLISGILLAEAERTGRIRLGEFWARRARRLLPAAATICVVVIVGTYFLTGPFAVASRAKTAIAFALYGSNILFARRAGDYFAATASSDPLLHTWSLSVEEQFYVVFAPLVLLLAVLSTKSGRATFRRRFQLAALAVTVGSFGLALLMLHGRRAYSFYLLPSRAWEFGLGALLASVPGSSLRIPPAARPAAAVTALLALIASAVLVDGGAAHPGFITLVPVLATVCIVATGSGGPTPVSRMLSRPSLGWIGRLSYSWYLWHWSAIVFLRDALGGPNVGLQLAVAVAALIPAAITYYLIERPVRYSAWLAKRPGVTLMGAAGLATAVVLTATTSVAANRARLRQPDLHRLVVATAALPAIYANGCHADITATRPKLCSFGAANADTSLVLFGDSHAAQWFPALERIVAQRGWSLTTITKSSCPSVDVPTSRNGDSYDACDAWRRAAIAAIRERRPTLLLISNFSHRDVPLGRSTGNIDASPAARAAWRDGMVATLAAVRDSTTRLVIVQDTPEPGFDVPTCLAKHLHDGQTACTMASRHPDADAVASAEAAAAAIAGAGVIDLSTSVCPAPRCGTIRNGVPVFRDQHHLTVAFAQSLSAALGTAIDSVFHAARSHRP